MTRGSVVSKENSDLSSLLDEIAGNIECAIVLAGSDGPASGKLMKVLSEGLAKSAAVSAGIRKERLCELVELSTAHVARRAVEQHICIHSKEPRDG